MEVAEFHGRVMASRLHIIAADGERTQEALVSTVQETVAFLEYLEQCWSRFIPSSDISRLNRLGPDGGALVVDPTTVVLLESMIAGFRTTVGRFDPSILRTMIAEGYSSSFEVPDRISSVSAGVTRRGALLDLVIDPVEHIVEVPSGLVIDPGGIGKGLAADLAVSRLLNSGLGGAMVEIGGDLAMAGVSIDPAGWLVDIEHPDPARGVLCSLAVSGGGVATSSVISRRWVHEGSERHHQIDPSTCTASDTDLTAVTVIAPTGWLAEVHATAALGAGSGSVIQYLEDRDLSGVAVMISPTSEQVLRTSSLLDIEIRTPSGAR